MQKKGPILLLFIFLILLILLIGGYFILNIDSHEKNTLTLEIVNNSSTLWDSRNKLAEIQVKRGEDNINIIGFDLLFIFSEGNVTHFVNDTIGMNGQKVFFLNLSRYPGDLEYVKLIPVFEGGIRGKIVSEIKIDDKNRGTIIPGEGYVPITPSDKKSGMSGGSGGGSGSGSGGDNIDEGDNQPASCISDSDCNSLTNECGNGLCSNEGVCYQNYSQERSSCSGGMCHFGNCVECILNSDCGENESCSNGFCFNSDSTFSFLWIGDDNTGAAPTAVRYAYTNFPDVEAIFYIPDLGRNRSNDYFLIAREWGGNPNRNPSFVPLFMGLGNHDAEVNSVVNYTSEVLGANLTRSLPGMKNFREGPYYSYSNGYSDRNLTYSFDYKNVHFIMWDVYGLDATLNRSVLRGGTGTLDRFNSSATYTPIGCITPDILEWLEYDLSHTNATFKFMFYHEGAHPVPAGRHTGDSLDNIYCPGNWVERSWSNSTTPPMRDKFWSILAKYNVTANFVGHAHHNTLTWTNDLYGGEGEVYEIESGSPPRLAVVNIREDNATLRLYNALYNGSAYNHYLPFGEILLSEDSANHAPQISQYYSGGEDGISPINRSSLKYEVDQILGTGSYLWFEAKDSDREDNLTFSFNNKPSFLVMNNPAISYSFGARWAEMYRRILLSSNTTNSNKLNSSHVGSYSFDVVVSDGKESDSLNIDLEVLPAINPVLTGASVKNGSTIHFPMYRGNIYFFCEDYGSGPTVTRYTGYEVKYNGQPVSCCSAWHSYSGDNYLENLSASQFLFPDDYDGIEDVVPGRYDISTYCSDAAGHLSNRYNFTIFLSNEIDISPVYGSWPTDGSQVNKLDRITYWASPTPAKNTIEVKKDGVVINNYDYVTTSLNGSLAWGSFDLLLQNPTNGIYQVKIGSQYFYYYLGVSPPQPSCNDGILNQDETGVDCGGSCPECSQYIEGTIYVDNSLSIDCSNYNPGSRTCGSGDYLMYNTLTEATSIASSGDLVYIRAGNYSEILKPVNSGSTYKAYNNEKVVIKGIATDSRLATHPDDPNYNYGPIWFEYLNNTIVEGIDFSSTEGWGRISRANNNTFKNCDFYGPTENWIIGLNVFESQQNKFINDSFDGASDNLRIIHSNNTLIEDSTFHNGRHVLLTLKCSSNNVIRENYFYNEIQKAVEILDCEQPTMFDHYNIYYQDKEIVNTARQNLIEKNIFAYTAEDNGDGPFNHIQYAGQEGIIRNNLFYNSNGESLALTIYGAEASYNYHNRIYNNVFYNNTGGIVTSRNYSSYPIYGNIFKNNIIYKNRQIHVGWADNYLSGSQISHRAMEGFLFKKNNIINSSAGENSVIWDSYNHRISLSNAQSTYPNLYQQNIEANPLFVNENGHNFVLQSGSPMINVGDFLATTVGSGSGTSMQVSDAKYFYDGFGINGENGDIIQLNGSLSKIRILDVNIVTNVLTLNQSASWTNGQGVSLAYYGAAPDIGAIEYSSGIAGSGGAAVGMSDEFETNEEAGAFKGIVSFFSGNVVKKITGAFFQV